MSAQNVNSRRQFVAFRCIFVVSSEISHCGSFSADKISFWGSGIRCAWADGMPWQSENWLECEVSYKCIFRRFICLTLTLWASEGLKHCYLRGQFSFTHRRLQNGESTMGEECGLSRKVGYHGACARTDGNIIGSEPWYSRKKLWEYIYIYIYK